MAISEEIAGALAAAGVGLGYAFKFLHARFKVSNPDDYERRKSSAAVLRSMREEIERLSDLVHDLSERIDTEISRRHTLELENGRLQDRVRHLESEVVRLGGRL